MPLASLGLLWHWVAAHGRSGEQNPKRAASPRTANSFRPKRATYSRQQRIGDRQHAAPRSAERVLIRERGRILTKYLQRTHLRSLLTSEGSALKRLRAACRPSQAWRMWSPSNVWSPPTGLTSAGAMAADDIHGVRAHQVARRPSTRDLDGSLLDRSEMLRKLRNWGMRVHMRSPASNLQALSSRPQRDRRRACA